MGDLSLQSVWKFRAKLQVNPILWPFLNWSLCQKNGAGGNPCLLLGVNIDTDLGCLFTCLVSAVLLPILDLPAGNCALGAEIVTIFISHAFRKWRTRQFMKNSKITFAKKSSGFSLTQVSEGERESQHSWSSFLLKSFVQWNPKILGSFVKIGWWGFHLNHLHWHSTLMCVYTWDRNFLIWIREACVYQKRWFFGTFQNRGHCDRGSFSIPKIILQIVSSVFLMYFGVLGKKICNII